MSEEYILQAPMETQLAEMNTAPFAIRGKTSALGIASKYANPDLIPQEEGAFARAMVEKHEKHAYHETDGVAIFSFDKKLNRRLVP